MKQDTEQKFNVLKDRLATHEVSQQVLTLLNSITVSVEQNNFSAAMNAHKDLTQKNWNEAKDWANAVKILITFKQRFQNS